MKKAKSVNDMFLDWAKKNNVDEKRARKILEPRKVQSSSVRGSVTGPCVLMRGHSNFATMDAHNSILVDLSRLPSRQARLVNTSVLMDASSQHLELALII